jgi:hypothetical protein
MSELICSDRKPQPIRRNRHRAIKSAGQGERVSAAIFDPTINAGHFFNDDTIAIANANAKSALCEIPRHYSSAGSGRLALIAAKARAIHKGANTP